MLNKNILPLVVILIAFVTGTLTANERSFNEAWYKENILGDLRAALKRYEHLYDADQTEKRIRVMAGMRASECHLKLGNIKEAKNYLQLVKQEVEEGSESYKKVVQRIRQLNSPKRVSDDNPPKGYQNPEIELFIKKLESLVNKRKQVLRTLRGKRQHNEIQIDRRKKIILRLRALGIEVLPDIQLGGSSQNDLSNSKKTLGGSLGAALDQWKLEPGDVEQLKAWAGMQAQEMGFRALLRYDLRKCIEAFEVEQEWSPSEEGKERIREIRNHISQLEGSIASAKSRLKEIENGKRALVKSKVEAGLRRLSEALFKSEVSVFERNNSTLGKDKEPRLKEHSELLWIRRILDWWGQPGIDKELRGFWNDALKSVNGEVWGSDVRQKVIRLEKDAVGTTREIQEILKELYIEKKGKEWAQVQLVEDVWAQNRLDGWIAKVFELLERCSGPEEVLECLELIYGEEFSRPEDGYYELLQLIDWFPRTKSSIKLRTLLERNL